MKETSQWQAIIAKRLLKRWVLIRICSTQLGHAPEFVSGGLWFLMSFFVRLGFLTFCRFSMHVLRVATFNFETRSIKVYEKILEYDKSKQLLGTATMFPRNHLNNGWWDVWGTRAGYRGTVSNSYKLFIINYIRSIYALSVTRLLALYTANICMKILNIYVTTIVC